MLAGDHDVSRLDRNGRAGGKGDAEVGSRQGCGVVDTVADHDRTGGEVGDEFGLGLGCRLGLDLLRFESQLTADRLGDGAAIAGQHPHGQPHRSQPIHGLTGVGANLVRYQQCADALLIDNDLACGQVVAEDFDTTSVDDTAHTPAGKRLEVGDVRKGETSVLSGAHDCAGDGVFAGGFDRSGESQQLVLGEGSIFDFNVPGGRSTGRKGAGLIENDQLRSRGPFDRFG